MDGISPADSHRWPRSQKHHLARKYLREPPQTQRPGGEREVGAGSPKLLQLGTVESRALAYAGLTAPQRKDSGQHQLDAGKKMNRFRNSSLIINHLYFSSYYAMSAVGLNQRPLGASTFL